MNYSKAKPYIPPACNQEVKHCQHPNDAPTQLLPHNLASVAIASLISFICLTNGCISER